MTSQIFVRVLLLAIGVVFAFPSLASRTPSPDDVVQNTEWSLLTTSGTIEGRSLSPAIRIGFSTAFMWPLNSSLELGPLGNDRLRYSRFNFLSIGRSPQVAGTAPSELWKPSGYLRFDALSILWAEGGHFAFSPGIEGGFSIRFNDSWAITLGGRATLHESGQGRGKDERTGDSRDTRDSLERFHFAILIGLTKLITSESFPSTRATSLRHAPLGP